MRCGTDRDTNGYKTGAWSIRNRIWVKGNGIMKLRGIELLHVGGPLASDTIPKPLAPLRSITPGFDMLRKVEGDSFTSKDMFLVTAKASSSTVT